VNTTRILGHGIGERWCGRGGGVSKQHRVTMRWHRQREIGFYTRGKGSAYGFYIRGMSEGCDKSFLMSLDCSNKKFLVDVLIDSLRNQHCVPPALRNWRRCWGGDPPGGIRLIGEASRGADFGGPCVIKAVGSLWQKKGVRCRLMG
jgi:hypothetical protein